MWAILEKFANRHQLLDYLYHVLVELSNNAVGFYELMDNKTLITSWWTAVNGHTCTYVFYQSGIWLAPSAGVVRSGLRCRVRSLFFFPKGFFRVFVSGSRTPIIAIYYLGYSSYKLSLAVYFSSLRMASGRFPLRTHLSWIQFTCLLLHNHSSWAV